jgi:hypothetical protein
MITNAGYVVKLRDSLGDMEHHLLIEHMQKANLAFLETDRQYKIRKCSAVSPMV